MFNIKQYATLLNDIKNRIRRAQMKAVLSANAEMLLMYWDIGRMIDKRQKSEGWGTGVIPRLAKDLCNDLSEVKGFSERNIKRMLAFYREYPVLGFVPQPVAQLSTDSSMGKMPPTVALLKNQNRSLILQQLVLQIPWGHNFLLMEKVKDLSVRLWYMEQTIHQGWVRDTLAAMIGPLLRTI